MSEYIELVDLHVRINTGDSAVGTYSLPKILAIDPDGTRQDMVATAENTTWLGADIPPAKLIGGRWRFAAEAINLSGKKRGTIWHELSVRKTGEVAGGT